MNIVIKDKESEKGILGFALGIFLVCVGILTAAVVTYKIFYLGF